MNIAALLSQSSLSLISNDGDNRIRETISQAVVVAGRVDVETVLGLLAHNATSPIPRSLDLIGHSTPDHSLLVLGDWVIDGTRSKVSSFFRGLADAEIFARLGIHSIRLLGCETAITQIGRASITAIAEITNVECFGTLQVIDATSYDGDGFRADRQSLLLSSHDIRRQPAMSLVKRGGEPYARVLDIEMLPCSPLGMAPSYPRKMATRDAARQILALVRRDAGAQMPGVLAPSCELALPSNKPGWFYRLELVLDGEFVRVFPDGDDRPGVVFPIDNANTLRAIIAELPYC